MKKILTLGLVLLTSACADNQGSFIDYGPANTQAMQKIDPLVGYQALEKATPCCDSLSELDYQNITKPGKLDLNITEKDQAFTFSTGKSFIKGFTLPKATGSIKITVSAPVIDSVFVPKVLVLNEQYEPVQVYGEKTIKLEKASLFNISRFFAEIELPIIITTSKQPKYLVVLTTEKAMKSTTKVTDLYKSYVTTLDRPAIITKITRNQPIAHTAIGAVRLAFDYLPDSQISAQEMLTESITTNSQKEAQALLLETDMPTVSRTEKPISTIIKPETEAMFIKQIDRAIKQGESDKALRLVEEAESAGSNKARNALFDALKKYKK